MQAGVAELGLRDGFKIHWAQALAGSNPVPGTSVDPITGLSRRALKWLGAALLIGLVASTVAAVLESRPEPGCPDHRYGCATFEHGEPVLVGALFPPGEPGLLGVRASLQARQTLRGHRLQVYSFPGRCSAEDAAEAAREFASDPPDEPPTVAVVAEACDAAEITAARILQDSGITLVSAAQPADPPVPARFYLVGPGGSGSRTVTVDGTSRELGATELAAFRAAEAVLDAAWAVAVEHDGNLLIPRTQLRDALLDAGLTRAS